MKNNVIKALALLLSVNCCFPGMSVKAEEPEEKTDAAMNLLQGADFEGFDNQSKKFQEPFGIGIVELPQIDSNVIPSLLEYQGSSEEEELEVKHLAEVDNEEKNSANKANTEPEDIDLKQLQIPQKLEVIIDPWEMDGKGQIYSEEYVIRNDGETPGVLTLSNLACKVSDESGVIVTTDRAGLHDSCEKLIYMQMIFGNGDRVDLSVEDSTYQVELQSGEELSICFGGEVNEYSSESWKDGDVAVTVAYSWDLKQTADKAMGKEEKTQDIVAENNTEETEELEEDDVQRFQDDDVDADSGDMNENKEGQLDGRDQEDEGAAKNEEVIEKEETNQTKEMDGEKEEPEVIELKEFMSIEFVIDKWERNEEGRLCSGQYLVRNGGETEGVFALSDFLFTYEEEDEIDVLRDREINDGVSNPSCIYLMLESGEEIDITQKVLEEVPEENGYKVILGPGGELKFRFVGEVDDLISEGFQKGNIIVKAIGSWDREEEKSVE